MLDFTVSAFKEWVGGTETCGVSLKIHKQNWQCKEGPQEAQAEGNYSLLFKVLIHTF